MSKFIGFNTIGRNFPSFTLTDVELIKRDLLNHFHTRKGERVMNPAFGTIIFDLLMNPQDEITRSAIIDDATRIVKSDPRVALSNINVQESDHAIILVIDLVFTTFGIRDSLLVRYLTETENT